jgi:SAM-dependent methyltransferase
MAEFRCNLCGELTRNLEGPLEREQRSCYRCGSTLRERSLIRGLTLELFGVEIPIPDIPRIKSLRGIGFSDSFRYASRLSEKFDYRNTFFDREPRLDANNIPEEEFGKYDFVISSEVFEHTAPPLSRAFENVFRMLKPDGVLLMTVPYSSEESMEHYPNLFQFGFAEIEGNTVLVNRTREGKYEVHEDPAFHLSHHGRALEVRVYSEALLRKTVTEAGFRQMKIYSDDYAPFGVLHLYQCSLPIAARKGTFSLSREATRDVMTEWLGTRNTPMRRAAHYVRSKLVKCRKTMARLQTAIRPAPTPVQSEFACSDPESVEFIGGFHRIEEDSWRWTERRFRVALRPPPASARFGGIVDFAFDIPESSLRLLGAITLTLSVNERRLGNATFESAGPQAFRTEIPAELLRKKSVTLDFELDKCIEAGKLEYRELGVIAHSVRLECK